MAPQTKTVLYATYVSPFPTNSGERIRALNLIAALRSLGYRVEAFVGNHNGVDLDSHNAEGLKFRQIPFEWPRLRQAASVYFRPHAEFIRQIRELHRAQPLSAIFLDYGFLGAQIPALMPSGVPIVLGTHNLESELTGQAPQDSLGAKVAIRLRQTIEAAHERRFFSLADAVVCVSEEDCREYAKFLSAGRLHIVPNFSDIPDSYGRAERLGRIIMSGSFDNFQNLDGLRWFVNEVWDDELRASAQLCIAGKHSDRAALEFADMPGIIGLGARDDLLSEIARSRCTIVPLRQGGGTRFKCLEAMAVRTPVVTTSKGCEGIDHAGSFRVADTAQEFKAAILSVLSDEREAARGAAKARSVFDRLYSLPANTVRLEYALASAAYVCSRRASARIAIS